MKTPENSHIRQLFIMFAFRHIVLSFILLVGAISVAFGQKSVRDSSLTITRIDAFYSFCLSSGDLSNRFGYFHTVGGGSHVKLRSNWQFGLDVGVQFGDQVRENTISNLVTEAGAVINLDGQFSTMKVAMRGISVHAKVGKVISVLAPNPNSGILLQVGGGFWRHRIRVEDIQQKTPQVEGDYQKGYDRMTNGPAFTGFLGYQLFSNSRLLNFHLGLEVMLGLTNHKRGFDYSTSSVPDRSSRQDISTGVKFGWSIPLYKRVPDEFYFD